MGTLLRLAALLFSCLALLAAAPQTVPAGVGAQPPGRASGHPPVCRLLETQASYISPGGLSLLQRECSGSASGASAVAPAHGAQLAGGAIDGSDRRLNDPAADELPSTTQSETTLETCGSTTLAAWNDSGSTRFASFTGYARSTDGGVTWQDRGHFPGLTGSDPWLASDRACRFYFAAITFMDGCVRIGVVRSDDGGLTWSAPANASPGTACANFQDKETIDVDRTGGPNSGNVYACWDDRGDSQLRVLFSRSTDGGGTFSEPQPMDFSAGNATGCQVAVGRNGEVIVTWTAGHTLGVYSRVSLDGGLSFSAAVPIAVAPVIGQYKLCGASLRPVLNGDIRTFNWTSLAVNPVTGTLHLAWNDSFSGNPDIRYTRSTDLGGHWSPPVRLNDDTGATDQFEPALAFTNSGALRAIWYDRRLDPGANFLIDVYSTVSTDDGATFTPGERITDVSFGVPPINPNFDLSVVPCYMGDYIAITGTQDTHYMAWGDNRNFVAGRPDPDIYFDTRSSAGQSFTVTRTDDPEPDGCLPGDCSLREASIAVITTQGADTITVPAGYYRLSRIGTGEDEAVAGDIDIGGNVLIRGAGADLTTVDAGGIERAFEVRPGVMAEITGMTVTGGSTNAGPGGPVADGGGILNWGNLTLDGLHITGNDASRAFGGGIHNAGTLSIRNSTVAGNTAGRDGGGVYNALNLTVANSTISGNITRQGKGGGLASAATAALNNVTLAANSAGPLSDVRAGNLSNALAGTLTVRNSIITGGDTFNCTGPITSLGHNLDDGDTCGLDAEGDLAATDPLLAPLADNGGPTPTHLPGDGSPALDAGDPATCETSDQRWVARPADGDADTLAVCDIGAVEAGARPLGDADCDFETDSVDALQVLRYVAGIQPFASCLDSAGDVNCDGVINGLDALAILRRIAGLPVQQEVGCPPIGS